MAALLAGRKPPSAPPDETHVLAGGEKTPPGGEGTDEAGEVSAAGGGEAEIEWTPKGLAKKLGTTVEKLYDLELTTGDGETVRLGVMKDAYVAQETARRETGLRAAELDERETSLAQDRHMLGLVLQELGPKLTPQLRASVAAKAKATEAREQAMLFQVAPELRDGDARATLVEELVEGLGPYGFKPNELRFTDHRLVWFARDALRAMKRLKELRENPPQPTPKEPPATHRPRGKPPQSRTGTPRTEAEKLAAVGALLKGR